MQTKLTIYFEDVFWVGLFETIRKVCSETNEKEEKEKRTLV